MTPEQRHKNMAAIRGKDTKPELIVRKGLWRRGFRYRLYSSRLPGHPDLVLRKYRTCIFVNGCFWHGHRVPTTVEGNLTGEGSDCCKIPNTHTDFWVKKIERNRERDVKSQQQLSKLGWHCITVWECELKPKTRERTLDALAYTLNKIWLEDHSLKKVYEPMEEDGALGWAAEERPMAPDS